MTRMMNKKNAKNRKRSSLLLAPLFSSFLECLLLSLAHGGSLEDIKLVVKGSYWESGIINGNGLGHCYIITREKFFPCFTNALLP
jgi:hypothetical protein